MTDRIIQAYPLVGFGDVATIVMPKDARIVDLGPHNGGPAIWAIVVLSREPELRRFKMVPDGFVVPERGEYIGSMTLIHADHAAIPMHFFEIPMPEESHDR